MFTLRDSVVVFAFALFLSACGGDQLATEDTTSTTTTTSTSSTEEPATLAGQAAKGVVQSGQVDAYALENGSRRHLASTQTDQQGNFSLQLGDFSSPVVLEVTPVGDGSSTMICDAVDGCGTAGFGASFPLPTDFLLSTLVTPADSDLSSIAVTPLTHIAAEWSQTMPGTVDQQKVELARGRVAGVFQLASGFAFQAVPDLTDQQSLDAASSAAARHALIAAGFSERAADTADSLQQVITSYSATLNQYAGQMENHGSYSLYELFDAGYEIADTQDILPDIRSELDLQIAALADGTSDVNTAVSFNQQEFDQALVTLDNLGDYLNQANVNSSGDFMTAESAQTEWLYYKDTGGLIEFSQSTVKAATVGAIMTGIRENGNLETADQIDLSYEFPKTLDDLNAILDTTTGDLSISGTANGQTVDLNINVSPLSGLQNIYEFPVQGSIENAVSTTNLDGKMVLNFTSSSDLDSIMTTFSDALQGNDSGENSASQLIKDLVSNLQLQSSFQGDASLSDTNNPSYAYDIIGFSGWGEWDIPALDEGGSLVQKEITTGELITPEGDMISDNPNTSAPALDIQIGDNSQIQADFITEAFGVPRMEFQIQGNIANTGDYLDTYGAELDSFLNSELSPQEFSVLTGMLPKADFSMLDISGSASLTIEDMELGQQVYEFTLDGTRIDASLPNSTDQALSFHITAGRGGYIVNGDTVVATVTFDRENLGATLYLVDGNNRGYFLGPITDLAPQEVMDGFQTALK